MPARPGSCPGAADADARPAGRRWFFASPTILRHRRSCVTDDLRVTDDLASPTILRHRRSCVTDDLRVTEDLASPRILRHRRSCVTEDLRVTEEWSPWPPGTFPFQPCGTPAPVKCPCGPPGRNGSVPVGHGDATPTGKANRELTANTSVVRHTGRMGSDRRRRACEGGDHGRRARGQWATGARTMGDGRAEGRGTAGTGRPCNRAIAESDGWPFILRHIASLATIRS